MANERRETGVEAEELKLPKRRPQHVTYDYSTAAHGMFDAFATGLRKLVLAPYDIERFHVGEGQTIQLDLDDGDDELPQFKPGTLAALCAAGLLNRFQSSIPAIER